MRETWPITTKTPERPDPDVITKHALGILATNYRGKYAIPAIQEAKMVEQRWRSDALTHDWLLKLAICQLHAEHLQDLPEEDQVIIDTKLEQMKIWLVNAEGLEDREVVEYGLPISSLTATAIECLAVGKVINGKETPPIISQDIAGMLHARANVAAMEQVAIWPN